MYRRPVWFFVSGLALSCFLIVVPAASQAALEDGVAAYNSGDYALAYREFLPIGEGGDKKAQLLLGLMYDNGLGVERDVQQAAYWYRRAAEQGLPRAQFNLGLMYESGEGVSADRQASLTWVRRSAEQGYAEAQDKLARFYEAGGPIERDLVQSHLWFSLVAAQGVDSSAAERDRIASQLSTEELEASRRQFQVWQGVYQSVF